jgi:hypothetical protein
MIIRSVLAEEFDDSLAPFMLRPGQRCPTPSVIEIDVGALVNEKLSYIFLAVPGRKV